MAASKPNSIPAASSDAVAITPIPADDIAELLAAPERVVEKLSGGTVRSTNTEYVDRTDNPVDDQETVYESETIELDGGTVLITRGDPVGGFPEVN